MAGTPGSSDNSPKVQPPDWVKSVVNSNVPGSSERIPRRPPPDFQESEDSLLGAIVEDGFFSVALDDSNQYGPHAMIMLLFAVATVTAIILLVPTLL